MQEVYFDGSKGDLIITETLEELIPHLKKSLMRDNVKHVIVSMLRPTGKGFKALEEKKNLAELIKEGDE